jgi:hypothetical protein
MSEPTRKPVSLDVHGSVMKLGEMVVRNAAEKACGGLPLWDKGLGDLVEIAVAKCDLPRELTVLDAARALGFAPPEARPAPASPTKPNRGRKGRR